MDKNILVKLKDDEEIIVYIGYYKMLDKILELMDKSSYENKILLIKKYIEIVKEINKGDSNE